MAKKISKTSKRRLVLFGTISFVIIGYFFVSLFTYTINLRNLKLEEAKLNQELLILKENEQNLKIELQKLKNPEYIARYAREKYLYSKDGEYIIDIKGNKVINEETIKQERIDNLKYIGVGLALIVLVVIYIYYKNKKSISKRK